MREIKIAAIPGDGIGKEVLAEGIKILNLISSKNTGVRFSIDTFDWGCEYYLENGKMMDDNGIEILKGYDAILLGAVGFPGVPEHISVRGLIIKIRQELNQYVNVRPIKLLKNVDCPLKDKTDEDIDMVFVRENVEGEYAGVGGIIKSGTDGGTAIQTSVFTRKNTEKVMEYAFKLAQKRSNKLTSVTKSNALNYSMVFWDKIFKEVSEKYNNTTTEQINVDAMSMYMVKKPERFDVVVASNLFGDILTDLGAAIQGGMGFAAGGNINPEGEFPSMFEPIHGSAPYMAGKGVANPIAFIWSVVLMIKHLELTELASALMKSIEDSLLVKERLTRDLGGNASTSEAGDYICELFANNIDNVTV